MIKLDDIVAHRGIYSDVCSFCKHKKDGYVCDAFKLIPEAIWFGQDNHTTPYPGDHGIQFKATDGE